MASSFAVSCRARSAIALPFRNAFTVPFRLFDRVSTPLIYMRKSAYLVLIVVVLTNLAVWAWFNRSQWVEPWGGTIKGVSFSPYRDDQNPFDRHYPSAAQIDADLAMLRSTVRAVRTYASTEGLEEVPRLAVRHKLKVTAGAWIDQREQNNALEINNLVTNVRRYKNVERVIVGNEAILRGDVTVAEMRRYLRQVRRQINVPVSTAEPWHVWMKHKELARDVDYIAIHVLPYWERVPAEQAVAWVAERYREVQAAFPGKPVLLAEVGWPSAGAKVGFSKPGPVAQARFVREFLNLARKEHYDYFIMEAFDQPWKRVSEGAAGAYWGIYDVERMPKYSMTGPLIKNPWWPVQAGLAALLALVPMIWFLKRHNHLRMRGRLVFAVLIQVSASMALWSALVPVTEGLTWTGQIVWGVLYPAQIALLLVVLINGFELAESLWLPQWRRRFEPLAPAPDAHLPKVSIHLAICNEPPAMVRATLDSLAALDYPDYEVLVIDNNTEDGALWQPVAAHCQLLGARFRFFHLGRWPGFKAGALNFALKETDPAAEIIAVVDSDYLVRSDWLTSLVPYFDNLKVGFVQAPQDHREWRDSSFKEMINWEYNGFFHIGMAHRNERNAIIQHGTMTLMRRAALEQTGRWSEWCICEDAELGMRLLHAGYESIYVNHSFGQGLTPDSFSGYKRQRFRWSYGAVQILKRHWRWLLPWGRKAGDAPGLSAAQRYHFAAGWLPWFSDALHLLFTAGGLLWTLGLVLSPRYFEFPLAVFAAPTLGIFVFKMLHGWWLYEAKVPCGVRQRFGAALAGMALTHTIARAMLRGLTGSRQAFLRTPKCESRPALYQGFAMASEELGLMAALWAAIAALFYRYGVTDIDVLVWAAVLVVQSLPYLAATVLSLVSVLPVRVPLPRVQPALAPQSE